MLHIALFLCDTNLHAALATAAASIRDLFARTFSSATPLRPGHTAVSAAWLTDVLRRKATIPPAVSVVSAKLAPLSANRGLSGTTCKLTVQYSDPSAAVPKSFIVKLSHAGFSGRKSTIISGQYREALFYNSPIAGRMHSSIPQAIYSHGSSFFGEFVIILEDVTVENNVTPVNFIFGNQIWGIPKPLAVDPKPLVVLQAMYMRAAEQHASYWNSRALLDMPWLKCAAWFRGRGRASWELAMQRARVDWERAKTSSAREALSPKLIAIVDKSLAAASWERLQLQVHNKAQPFTACHGDFHAANMFLRHSNAYTQSDAQHVEIIMFDWSEVSVWDPVVDLVQTLISDVKPELYKHTRDLVHAYWLHLTSHGVSKQEYSFDDCWESFCRRGPSRWLWVFPVLASFPGMPVQAVRYFNDQLLAFIEAHGDHDCYDMAPVVFMI
jgi:hypothetical protein